MKILILLIALTSLSVSAAPWEVKEISFLGSKIRSGIKRSQLPVKGHVLYLQGLGDSMMNHEPLFNALTQEGYSVIAFDYRGQGGSGGKMNETTIKNINELSEIVWEKYVSSKNEKKILLGWSTGGLAAYRYAYLNPTKTKSIILLAPGISPKLLVGECLEITEESLTSNAFRTNRNPHVDPIKPNSPILVPLFSSNLLLTAKESQEWVISPRVKGMVFLSDEVDTYVNRQKTKKIMKRGAPHFKLIDFQGTGALHELDNEVPEVAERVRQEMIDFLNK